MQVLRARPELARKAVPSTQSSLLPHTLFPRHRSTPIHIHNGLVP